MSSTSLRSGVRSTPLRRYLTIAAAPINNVIRIGETNRLAEQADRQHGSSRPVARDHERLLFDAALPVLVTQPLSVNLVLLPFRSQLSIPGMTRGFSLTLRSRITGTGGSDCGAHPTVHSMDGAGLHGQVGQAGQFDDCNDLLSRIPELAEI
jgi:hypothetical protein